MIVRNKQRMKIVDEINFVIKKMNSSQNISQKLFYFSGIHALIQNIFNQDYDEDLIVMHLVLHSTYTNFMNRFNAVEQGADRTVELYDEQIEGLTASLKELAEAIEKKANIDNILKRFIVLSYSTTGNGYYLLQKGFLKI